MDQAAVLIPVHDGGGALGRVVSALRAWPVEVLVVDDGSTDGAPQALAAGGVAVHHLSPRGGKGRAVREGLRLLLSRTPPPPWILLMDGDGQHRPEEVGRFLSRMRPGLDLLVGDRMGESAHMPGARRWTNRIGSTVLRWISGQAIPDTQCGYRALTAELAAKLDLESSGYDLETEVLLKSLRLGARWEAVPVSAVYEGEPSHFRGVPDTYRICMAALRYAR